MDSYRCSVGLWVGGWRGECILEFLRFGCRCRDSRGRGSVV